MKTALTTHSPLRRQLLAAAAGVALIVLLLVLLLLSQRLPEMTDPTLEVREISLALPPPPPPPPAPVTPPQNAVPLDVATAGSGPSLPVLDVPQEITLTAPADPQLNVQEIKFSDIAPDWDAFDLSELDSLPTLLTPVSITLPASLKRRGVKLVSLRLEVTINEQGQVSLNRIVENPYPELNPEIQRLIRNSRFTAPQKDGASVRARFIWPIDIKP
ncbi:energy transducer TonB [Thalassolituus marinus]|uniref:TonB C-terminal domain-containing protein n=1 Tax=Thalassolituus marinus TaxID=671053 RepID=A0ABS7ZTF4_9GAMM|nr:energy transducer TonB [Thalassolituus marinus]MCA6063676.1 hypothetical protein [Thalassolituus marinus]